MVITPDINTLPYYIRNGVKCFELVAEPVQREILPGIYINGWGYNGSIPGPTIMVYPKDYVNIRVYNKLPEDTSVHWHGLDVPNVMDGVPSVEPSPSIQPGKYFDYHFQIRNPPGTHMYHAHTNTVVQEMMGLGGGFIILDPHERNIQHDYFLMLQSFGVKGLKKGELNKGIYDVNPFSMEFNFFTVNGRSFPHLTPMTTKYGDNVRIRLGVIGEGAHPMHIHGHQFYVSSIGGNSIPYENRLLRNTQLVATGETYDLEFNSYNPGIWPFHCHIPHHTSNNLTEGTGGMFTTIRYTS